MGIKRAVHGACRGQFKKGLAEMQVRFVSHSYDFAEVLKRFFTATRSASFHNPTTNNQAHRVNVVAARALGTGLVLVAPRQRRVRCDTERRCPE